MGKLLFSHPRVIVIPIAAGSACCLLAFLWATNHGVYDYDPHWSSTGQAIAFACFPPAPELNLDLTQLIELRRYYGDMPCSPHDSEICTMAPNGGERRRLTNNRAQDSDPVWSPDGTHIAFVSQREDRQFLYLMNGDGTDQRRLSPTRGAEHPAWSPDGQRIAFTTTSIQVLDLASGVERALNHTPADFATWSPQGDAVAFVEGKWLDDSCRTSIVRADTGEDLVPPFASACQRVAWDPLGSRLAFVGAELQPMQGRLLFVFDLHAHSSLPLTSKYQYVGDSLVWSPSGDRVFYVAGDEIFAARIHGSGSIQVTNGASVGGISRTRDLTLSPDGEAIAFVRAEGVQAKAAILAVWRVNSDGSRMMRLSQ